MQRQEQRMSRQTGMVGEREVFMNIMYEKNGEFRCCE